MNELKKANDLTRIVSDFKAKYDNVQANIEQFNEATMAMKMNGVVLETDSLIRFVPYFSISEYEVKKSLRASAWRCVYKQLNISMLASAKDKKRFEDIFNNAPEFTMENVKAAFADYLENPRGNILRGLAEVFCELDDAYKSHSKVKIGVKGLPKRVIFHHVSTHSYGYNKIENVLNALAQVQGLPLVEYYEMNQLLKEGEDLKDGFEHMDGCKTPARGVWLKRFANGNAHLFFNDKTLRDINMGLAEYYGLALPNKEK